MLRASLTSDRVHRLDCSPRGRGLSRDSVRSLCKLPMSFWRDLPTISEGVASDLKISTMKWRFALSRLTIADGVGSDFCVEIFQWVPDVELFCGGGWDRVATITNQPAR